MNIAILGGFPLFPKGRLASLIPAVTTTDSLDAQTIARLATDHAAAQLASGIRLNSSQAVAAVMSGETVRAEHSTA